MSWLIHPLPLAPFRPLLALSDVELEGRGARRMMADRPNAAPCRVSLVDAEPGEALILTNWAHLDAPASPYRQAGPVFVRQAAVEVRPTDAVPDVLARRLLSVRAFDAEAMMTDAEVVEGRHLAAWLDHAMANTAVTRVQVHSARRGCFLAEARRG